MTIALVALIWILGLLLLVPTWVFFTEVLLSRTPADQPFVPENANQIRAVVLIPAHNEETGIVRTIRNLKTQLGPSDFILVVADNCSDRTAQAAENEGAQVVVREDLTRRGKGFAVAHGLQFLKSNPVDVVVFVDADCVMASDSIPVLKSIAHARGGPVQSLNLMRAPAGHERRYAVAEFAWRVKNRVRPLGLALLGLPCQLMGTGMAMPFRVAERLDFASSNVVEDLELGIKLTRLGYPAVLTLRSRVDSEFPITQEGEAKQRRRWEGGSLSMLLRCGAKTFFSGLFRGKLALLALGLDMLVPPLVTHAAGLVFYLFLCAFAVWAVGQSAVQVLGFSVALLLVFILSVGIAWWKAGRDVLPVRHWPSLLSFVGAKLRIHKSLPRSDAVWVRADRTKDTGG